MRPFEIVADAAHEYSNSLPATSADRALLFSRRYGFAAAAIRALEQNGFAIVTRETVESLHTEATLNFGEASFLRDTT